MGFGHFAGGKRTMTQPSSGKPRFRKSSTIRSGRRAGRAQRSSNRSPFLTLERFEDRILLTQPASASQIFVLSSNVDYGPLYLRDDLPSHYIQYSTNNTTWSNLVSIDTG